VTIFLILAIIFLLLIFPIKSFIYTVADLSKFSLKFDGFIYCFKVINGEVFLKSDGLYIKNGKNNEKKLLIKDVLQKRRGLKPFSFGYKIKNITVLSELTSNLLVPLTAIAFLVSFGDIICSFLENKYQTNLKYFVALKDESIKKIYIKTVISFCGFSIIISLIKLLINKLRGT